jgi:A118 family predicted phage portal protein
LIPGTEDPKAPWPPAWMAPVMARYEVWAAWHSGDPEKLAGVYAGYDGNADTTGFFASEAGGFKAKVRRVISNVVRYFWGQRTDGKARRRLHVPIAGDIASASADLLFAEPLTAKAVDDNGDPVEAAQLVLDRIMESAQATLLEGGETGAALSGVVLRSRWDTEAEQPFWFDTVAPDCFVPYWQQGRLAEGTLWKVVHRDGDYVYRHLEHHRPGEVEHGLYQGADDALGVPVPLNTVPELAHIASEVGDDGTIASASQRLAIRYVPNMRPNRIWRDIPQAHYLGVSDFSGIELLMDALDLTASSLMRDVELGKARIVVPKSYLNDHGRGEGASFDLDREIYEPVSAMQDEDKGMQIQFVQANIRVDELERVMLRLKTDAIVSAGYSPHTFGMKGDVAATATEVKADVHRSLTTLARKAVYWTPELRATLETLLEMAGHSGVNVVLEWPDAVAPDPKAESEKVMNWRTAEAASLETAVGEIHPDWTPEQVDDEVKRIKQERAEATPEDPGSFRGGTVGEQDDDAADEDQGGEPGDDEA